MAGGNAGGIADVLGSLERERSTGALRVGDEGVLHIVRGSVAGAESRHAPGLSGPDPESAALLAMFDAAYFLLGSAAEPVFTEGPANASSRRVTAATLVHEQRRRRAMLDAAWPDGAVDVAPVVPVRRVRRQRVILTGLQAEILLNADGRSTPAQLARELGRTAFACLLAVRGLAAASLLRIELPETVPPPVPSPAPGPPVQGPPVPAQSEPSERTEIQAEWAPPDHDLLNRLRTALAELG
ncbi:transcriptional regulator [Actinomadura sp. 7K507]|uniref:transcriptional regulator n=1 Tax=Actinomadura sp. 7K507 TaxID=2530365 RepID=UPI00104B9035|nr:transcriptional regulator [Actinomadura sp. 7K507]TDC87183.1 transcriptional regulator [Actinomadura sp. 7K507]